MPSLLAVLGLSTTPFNRNLVQARQDAKRAGGEIGNALGEVIGSKLPVALSGAGIATLIEKTLEAAERFHALSAEFRVSTDTVQVWDKAARQVGMTAEDIGNAFNRLKKAREGAITKGDVGGFGAFGIGMSELKYQALSMQQIMEKIRASATSHPITDQEDVAGMELMGRSGAKLLSVLQKVHELGPIPLISKENLDTLHEANEAIEEAGRRATIATGQTLGFMGRLSQMPGVGLGWFSKKMGDMFEATKGAITGTMDPMSAAKLMLGIGNDDKGVARKKTEEGGIYRLTKTVDLHKDAAEIEKLKAQLAEKILQNQLKGMTVAERRAKIEELIADHMKKSVEFEFGEGDDKKALEEKIEAENLRGELERQDKKTSSKYHYQAPEANDRIRIGAFGPQGVELNAANASVRSEHHLARIEEHLSDLRKNQRRTKY